VAELDPACVGERDLPDGVRGVSGEAWTAGEAEVVMELLVALGVLLFLLGAGAVALACLPVPPRRRGAPGPRPRPLPLTEGHVKRGGVNPEPLEPKPAVAPRGQGVPTKPARHGVSRPPAKPLKGVRS
jgi:hypothetical protein